jgi:hypothetical protein
MSRAKSWNSFGSPRTGFSSQAVLGDGNPFAARAMNSLRRHNNAGCHHLTADTGTLVNQFTEQIPTTQNTGA